MHPIALSLSTPSLLRRALALGLLSSTAFAQWIATPLPPAGASSSGCNATDDQARGGFVKFASGGSHAALWQGTTNAWSDLHPASAQASEVLGVDGANGAGFVTLAGTEHAAFWPAGSFVDLHPANAPLGFSRAWGAGDGKQVGYFSFDGWIVNACLWTGSAASRVDLSPPGSTFAVARDAAAGIQVGQVHFAGGVHAARWSGSAASFVDLHPASGWDITQAIATDGQQHVGRGVAATFTHAVLWPNGPGSMVVLTPSNAASAEALAVDGGMQVGWYNPPFGYPQACLWSGSAASVINLHNSLPPQYAYSKATGIWHDANGRTFVSGFARDLSTMTDRAFVWSTLVNQTYCTARVNSLGCTPAISPVGQYLSATRNDYYFVKATNVLNSTNGLLVYGAAGRASVPFGGGTLCVGSPRLRSIPLNSGGSNPPVSNCTGVFLLDLHGYRAGTYGGSPAPFLSVPGTLVNFQFWGRDPGFVAPNNAQLSNALELEIGP